ncbi:hypothetical protein ABIE62_001433 [Porphyrobacter sp. MBR-155]
MPLYVWVKSDLSHSEDAGAPERRPAPAKAGGNVSIPQEAFIAALRMGEE